MPDEKFPQQLSFSITLDCAPERAFAVLADVNSWPLWFDGCKGCEWESAPPHELGARRTIRLALATAAEEITVFQPGKRFSFKVTKLQPPLVARMQEDIQLTAADGATRADWVVSYEPSVLGLVIHPLARMFFSRMFKRSLAGLKRFTRPAAE